MGGVGGQDLKGYLKGTLKVPLKGTFERRGPAQPPALQGFDIDNTAAYQAIEDSKALHARRWQTKEGMYRIKRQALPDVRDAPLYNENAAASSTDVQPRWRSWDGDYAMGYQRHP